MTSKGPTLDIDNKQLHFVRFLHHGSGGLTSIYQDDQQNRYILKSTLGESAVHEAALNKRLSRLHWHGKDSAGEHLLLSYIEGEDVDRFLAKHLSTPPMDDIGCACFEPSYMQKPYGSFVNGSERNITIAIKLVQAQEALVKQNILHVDIQLPNYVIKEDGAQLTVEGIDFGTAVDMHNLPDKKRNFIISRNISALIEALKAILPREQFMLISALQSKQKISYANILTALEKQLSPKVIQSKNYIPSFVSGGTLVPSLLPERTINRRDIDFMQRRLENSIRKNNPDEAKTYLLHGAKLDGQMVEQIKAKANNDMLNIVRPYLDDYESEQLAKSLQGLNIKNKPES